MTQGDGGNSKNEPRESKKRRRSPKGRELRRAVAKAPDQRSWVRAMADELWAMRLAMRTLAVIWTVAWSTMLIGFGINGDTMTWFLMTTAAAASVPLLIAGISACWDKHAD